MEITGLTEMKDRLIRNLSKGYKQRVGIAQAMLGSPDIIILDEPTVGLDPKQILEIRELIRRLGETKTVILSSHILAEISAVCERVMIISHGNLVANDTIENLEALANRSDKLSISVRGDRDTIISRIEELQGVIVCSERENSGDEGIACLEIELEKAMDIRDSIFFAMADLKYPIISMQYEQTTLEDIFLALTDDDIRPDGNGVFPTVEEILEGRSKKESGSAYENLIDEEPASLADEEPADLSQDNDAEEENDQSQNEDGDNDENDNDSDNGGDYKPLFGGKN